jgi:hypothetical protein
VRITVAEMPEFTKRADKLLGKDEYQAVIDHLSAHPKDGVLLEGTGGIRKLRWSRPGMGKSGGVRVIYFFHDDAMPLYLLTVFGKNERANLSKAERNDLAKLAVALVNQWRSNQ